MISQQTKDFIPEIQKCLRKQPVEKAWLFGSYSRGEETEGSDVDIMVRYDNRAPITLFTISKIMLDIKKVLGKDVDLVEEDQLLPFAQESANKDKLLIYERES